MSGFVWSWLKGVLARRPQRCSHRFRPRVERLEDRTLLAGDIIQGATALTFTGFNTAHVGNFLSQANEVDLYSVHLGSGDRISVNISAQTAGSGLQSILRVFNSNGTQVALDDQEGGDPHLTFQAATAGDYFIGVSSAGDDAYNPNVTASGHGGTTTGIYSLAARLTPQATLQEDLTGSSFRLGTDTAVWGGKVPLTFTVENRGGTAAGGTARVQLVLSDSNIFDPAAHTINLGQPISLAGLGSGQQYESGSRTIRLPALSVAQAAGFARSGPVFLGVRIIDDTLKDFSLFDKTGVHRGEDWETLTVVTQGPAGVTDLSSVDPSLNARVSDTLASGGQTRVYTFTVTDSQGSGRLTAHVTPLAGSTVVPRLTLFGPDGQFLIQSDDGVIVQHLLPLPTGMSYSLTVSAVDSGRTYQLTTQFFGTSSPFAELPVTAVPSSVGAADLNGDGNPDLIATEYTANSVSVLLGSGDGTFQSLQPYSVGAGPTRVTVADLRGNGKADLIVSNLVDGTVSVLLGNGDGTFQDQHIFAVGNGASWVAVADVNGDGNPDLAVTNYTSAQVSVLLGNGDGTFQPPQPFDVGSTPRDVAVADVNGDGAVDLVVANAGDDTLSVLLGQGDGTFQSQKTYAVGTTPESVVVADLRGNGVDDLVVTNTHNNTVGVLLGNGDGTFQPQLTFSTGSLPVAVVIGDVNQDGKPDLVVANQTGFTVGVLLGKGDGTFQPQRTVPVAQPLALELADFNGDGNPDLVAANYITNTVSVLLGDGDGAFKPPESVVVGSDPVAVTAADLNGDGKPDLITANKYAGSVSVLLGNSDGTFQSQKSFAEAGQGSAAVVSADVNGDGKPDLIVVNTYSNSVSVLLGNGDGTFQRQHSFPVGTGPFAVATADINADGKLDLLVANDADDSVSVLLGKGDGTFRPQHAFAAGSTPSSLKVADFNGDGKPDLLVADYNSASVSVLLGNGNGTFRDPLSYGVGRSPRSVAVAKINGDNIPDIITANAADGTVSVLLSDGAGAFHSQRSFAVGAGPMATDVADVNGDGIPDIITANYYDSSASVLLGDGLGSFVAQPTVSVGALPLALVLADVNGDGKSDVITTSPVLNTVTVALGNGDGTFNSGTSTNGTGMRNTPYSAKLTNHDGSLDTVILDRAGNILFRKGLPGTAKTFSPPVSVNGMLFNNQTKKTEELTARDLTVLRTATGWAIATADAIPDPNILATEHQFVYSVSLYEYAAASGKFQPTTAFTSTILPTRIAAADLVDPTDIVNGIEDLVVANSLDNSVTVAIPPPSGSSNPTWSTMTIPVGIAPSDIAFADVNGDGWLDIVVTDQASGDVTVLLNDASHSFKQIERFRAATGLFGLDTSSATVQVSSLARSVSLAAGDFTGDGLNDVVVVNRGSHSFTVLPNDGNGGFRIPTAALTTSTSDGLAINDQPGPVVAGHFRGPTMPLDLAILMVDRAEVWIFTNDGKGHFSHTSSAPAGTAPTGLSLDSVTGDLLVGNQFGDILRLIGNGDGTFHTIPFTGSRAPLDVQSLRGDGTPNVLIASQASNQIAIQDRSDTAHFAPVQNLAGDPTSHMAPGDVKWTRLEGANGLFDAVVMGSGSNMVQVFHALGFDAAGQPILAPPLDIPVGSQPVGVTIQDINGDTIPDMLVANQGSNDVSVLFGGYDSKGLWIATPGPRLKSSGNGPISTTLRDLNGDGILDLAITNADGTVSVLPGRGQGFFDDRTPATFNVSGGIVASSFAVGSDIGLAITGAGNIVSINLDTLASAPVFQPAGGVEARAIVALAGGDAVVAFSDGTVAELAPDVTGQLAMASIFDPLTGLPPDPSALAVFDTGTGIQVFVTSAGEDLVFVFAPPSPTGPVTEVTTSEGSPLTLVITLLAGNPVETDQTVSTTSSDENTPTTDVPTETTSAATPRSGSADKDADTDPATNVNGDAPEIGVDVDNKLKDADLRPQMPDPMKDGPTSNRELSPFSDPMPAVQMLPEVVDSLFSAWTHDVPATPKLGAVEQAVAVPAAPALEESVAAPFARDAVTDSDTSAGPMGSEDRTENAIRVGEGPSVRASSADVVLDHFFLVSLVLAGIVHQAQRQPDSDGPEQRRF